MKELLDTYVRSLTEQEQAGDAPERYQDLGTFVCWLLERQGYELHVRAYRRDGVAHKKSTGRQQWGVDILASKPDSDDVERAWCFVLKRGDIGTFAPDSDGNIFSDLWLAAGRHPSDDSRHAPGRGTWERTTIVAVHNGELDTDRIGAQVDRQLDSMREKHGVNTEWWDASKLVSLALEPPADPGKKSLTEQADASLFPPLVRPFARMTLDSLQRDRMGATFDLDAVNLLIENILPLDRTRTDYGPGATLAPGTPIRADRLYRAASELALFAGMLEVECRRVASGNTIPVLDTIARILCRLMEHIRRLDKSALSGFKRKLKTLLENLVGHYIVQAQTLRERLEPLLDAPYSLALPINGERIDYPLRTLRLGAYLATAGLACLDRDNGDEARRFAEALGRLSKSNAGGLLNPIVDDQIIELGAIWMLWLRLGMHELALRSASQLIQLLSVRLRAGQPLPALYLRASQPMDMSALRMLVDVHYQGRDAAPGFNDSGSTILPLAVVLCTRTGNPVPDELLGWFRPQQTATERMRTRTRVVYAQSWQPPDDAADEWYAAEIRYRGLAEVYDLAAGAHALVQTFEQFHGTQPPISPASAWGLPVIDWLAFCVWRTPPPMSLFLQPDLWPA